MSLQKVLKVLEEVLDSITLTRFATIIVFITMVFGSFLLFENRAAVFAKIYKTTEAPTLVQWSLSDLSRAKLAALTGVKPIVGVLVQDVDLKKNRRIIKYQIVRDPQLSDLVTSRAARLLPQPLFDFDNKNTEQMVSMLNNEFSCFPTADTNFKRNFPELEKQAPFVCNIAIPPWFGEFVGYMTVLLSEQPSEGEFDAIKLELNRVAIEMYLRDVAKRPA